MNWLARLKQQAHPVGTEDSTDAVYPVSVPRPDATEPTKPGSVGFVAPMQAPMQKIGATGAAANDATKDAENPDRWAWPHSDAMNGAEIDSFTARLVRFTDRGLDLAHAEALADTLTLRDRESDERRHCLECARLNTSGQCGQRRAVLDVLQRCHVFKDPRPLAAHQLQPPELHHGLHLQASPQPIPQGGPDGETQTD